MSSETFLVREEADLITLRRAIDARSIGIQMSLINRTKLMTVVNELGRNMIVYGGGGHVTVEMRQRGTQQGIQLTFTDQGRGIADMEAAMRDGYSTAGGLGVGLPGARRLMDEFSIDSVVGRGTTVRVTKW